MERGTFLKAGAALAVAAGTPLIASAADGFDPKPGSWRTFEITTTVDVADAAGGMSRAWIPVPSVTQSGWIEAGSNTWKTNAPIARLEKLNAYGGQMLYVEWPAEKAPTLELKSQVKTRDLVVDLSKPGNAPPLTPAERTLYLASTKLIPTDGIVKETALKITSGANTDMDKARAIYEWVVSNTFRDAKVIGCGTGDIRGMLVTGNLGGKCADINALYVGLARASGLPARDLYGIRVAPSKFGYKAMGANTNDITKSQHCRAQVFLTGYGWVPVDPADVRKVALEEPPGNLAITDPKVVAARKTLFGAWETNWIAYNSAHDIVLPNSNEPAVAFLMYPEAKNIRGMCDCYAPEKFKYQITTAEITA